MLLICFGLHPSSNHSPQKGFVPDLTVPKLNLPAFKVLPKPSQSKTLPPSQSFLTTRPSSEKPLTQPNTPFTLSQTPQFFSPPPSLNLDGTLPTPQIGGTPSSTALTPLPVPALPDSVSALPSPDTLSIPITGLPPLEDQRPDVPLSLLDLPPSQTDQTWRPDANGQPIQPPPQSELSVEDFTSSLHQWLLYHRRIYGSTLRSKWVTLYPEYPQAACRDRLQGRAILPALVDPNGRIEVDQPNPSPSNFLSSKAEAFVQDTGHVILNDAAIEAAQTYNVQTTGKYQALFFVIDFRYATEVCTSRTVTFSSGPEQ